MILDLSFWELVKQRMITRNAGNKIVETWLQPVEFSEAQPMGHLTRMVLKVPSHLHKYFVEQNLLEKIYSEVAETYREPFDIEVEVSAQKSSETTQSFDDLSIQGDILSSHNLNSHPEITIKIDNIPSAGNTSLDSQGHRVLTTQVGNLTSQVSSQNRSGNYSRTPDSLNPEYTFSTFVVGRNTEFAHAASYNVAQNPGAEGYNPLFICGPVGMGKTHLLNALGNQIKSSYPDLKIHYFSVERFLNECVSGIRRQEMDKFRQKYRESSDILLVDDVQYIGKTEAVQEEFFHMINSFIEKKRQVVVASDRMPKDITGLADRSRSRLEWGLIADITMPDIETRVAILRYKAERKGMKLPEEVVNYIARISKRSIRELEGNLNKVKMFSELQGAPIELELTKRVLVQHETQTTITMEEIERLVAGHYKVRPSDLKAATRAKQIVIPRQIAMYLIKRHLDKSLVDIGKEFGGKDHTTVMNAISRVEYLQSKDADIRNDIEDLTSRIHNITGV